MEVEVLRIFSIFAILFATSVAYADAPPMAVHFIDVVCLM